VEDSGSRRPAGELSCPDSVFSYFACSPGYVPASAGAADDCVRCGTSRRYGRLGM